MGHGTAICMNIFLCVSESLSECIVPDVPHYAAFTFTFRAFWQTPSYKATYKEYICWKRDSKISPWYIKIRIEPLSSIHSCEVNRTSFIIAR